MSYDLLWLCLLLLGGLYWLYAEQRHRLARLAAQQCCRDAQVQWLDQAVVLASRHWRKLNHQHWPVWLWIYTFEYSRDGAERLVGEIVIHSHAVQWVSLGDTITQEPLH
jgi:Protein of unknown function (DUF3301)